MGTKVAEKKGGKKEEFFTYMSGGYGAITTIMATGPRDVDNKTNKESSLIIRGRAEDIGATRVKEMAGQSFSNLEKEPEKGSLCTIIVGDPVRIKNVTYCGIKMLNNDHFLAFTKNGISFWAFKDRVRFISIW